MKIDEKAGVVTFDNHGTVQELPLVRPALPGRAGPEIPPPGGPGGRTPFIPTVARAADFGSVPCRAGAPILIRRGRRVACWFRAHVGRGE